MNPDSGRMAYVPEEKAKTETKKQNLEEILKFDSEKEMKDAGYTVMLTNQEFELIKNTTAANRKEMYQAFKAFESKNAPSVLGFSNSDVRFGYFTAYSQAKNWI